MTDFNPSQQQNNQNPLHPILSSSSSSSTSRNVSPSPAQRDIPLIQTVVDEAKHHLDTTPANSVTKNITTGRQSRSSTMESGLKSPVKKGHLRTLSIASSSSASSPIPSHSNKKMGINLGLNVFGGAAPGTSSTSAPASASSITVGLGNEPVAAANITEIQPVTPLAGSESATLTPTPIVSTTRNLNQTLLSPSPLRKSNEDLPSTPLVNPVTPTRTHPQDNDHVSSTRNTQDLELSEKLRLLASKEMDILDLKNQIKKLVDRKREMELELQDLKVNVEKQLISQLSQQTQMMDPSERRIPKSPIRIQKQRVRAIGSTVDPLLDATYSPEESPNQQQEEQVGTHNKSSWFSKPLNFIQQFDNMIYQEFEKLHLPNLSEEGNPSIMNVTDKDAPSNSNKEQVGQKQQEGASSTGDPLVSPTPSSFEDLSSKEISNPIKDLANDTSSARPSDVMHSMSSHIWSFVNEVKTNLMTEDTNSTNSRDSPSPRKFRTPSLSNRQTYGQYSRNRRRASSSANSTSNSTTSKNINSVKNEPFTNVTLADDSTMMLNSIIDDDDDYDDDGRLPIKKIELKDLGSDGGLSDNNGTNVVSEQDSEQFDQVTDTDLWDNDESDF
ncbi:hypothetical protein CANARDRAFT_70023 [[Candida] arabinofermentans NRRL YB-2248]|uniref:Topoisomerase I damage affected protein 11 n=1 Tax=[Candida] arabinofermentans NRRL YB-2248 TaxID=983967 RepID=A0A1E4SWU9_9ASCO|nr:hypothetical protein CANARDRAFT_70023 [[Candida] arabinofermentans NRRL YB-2248]